MVTDLLDFHLKDYLLSETLKHELRIAFMDIHNTALPGGHKHQSVIEHITHICI
jgi:hypothetical protein